MDDQSNVLFRRKLRELRKAAGMSGPQLAGKAHYTRGYVWEIEAGRKRVTLDVAARLDEALDAGGALAALVDDEASTFPTAPWLDEPDEIEARRNRMTTSNIDEAKLQYLEDAVRDLISDYERRPPAAMAPRVRELRRYVDGTLAGRQPIRQRDRLYGVAVHLCGLLGALALDLGLPIHARAYGLEAFDVADASGWPDLQAWARAVQSLIAYYAGDYHEAVAYARDGQRRAPTSPHGVRLTINGEARALARLGDAYGVDEAVGRGFALLANFPAAPGVTASMTLGAYCQARACVNAATAYLSLQRPAEVERYAGPALAVFDQAELRGPQALTRLDLATAALMAPRSDPERAAEFAAEAMVISAPQRFESVTKRAREFLDAAQPWARQPEIRAVAAAVEARSVPAIGAGPVEQSL